MYGNTTYLDFVIFYVITGSIGLVTEHELPKMQ